MDEDLKTEEKYNPQNSEHENKNNTISEIEEVIKIKLSKKKFFKRWLKLTWSKKKVYLQLIPHFFDQATDFGVIFEYYRLSTEDQDTPIGINTWYLFWVSIGVIILHRIFYRGLTMR